MVYKITSSEVVQKPFVEQPYRISIREMHDKTWVGIGTGSLAWPHTLPLSSAQHLCRRLIQGVPYDRVSLFFNLSKLELAALHANAEWLIRL